MLNKYKKLLDKDYKVKLIKMMEDDVKIKQDNISKYELEHFCNSLYVLCILEINNIKKEDIIKQLIYRNNIFISNMERKGEEVAEYTIKLDYYTKLKNKYLKIIKNFF